MSSMRDALPRPDDPRPDDLRILVVGAGATGGYFGGRLIEAGRDVTFLVRPGRVAQLAAGGLQIISGHGDLTLQPKLVTADAIDGHYHLILLSVKAYGLEQALLDIAPAVGKDTIILPLLNGLRHIDRLRDTFGKAKVLGGVCVVSATLDGAGRVVQLAGMQELTYGPLRRHPTRRVGRPRRAPGCRIHRRADGEHRAGHVAEVDHAVVARRTQLPDARHRRRDHQRPRGSGVRGAAAERDGRYRGRRRPPSA